MLARYMLARVLCRTAQVCPEPDGMNATASSSYYEERRDRRRHGGGRLTSEGDAGRAVHGVIDDSRSG